jgi:hypothetical protein
MENMAEEELLPQEKEEAQVRVPTRAPDSAPVPAPAADTALDSAPTPDSDPAPALAPAPAPALSPSLASVPEEAESSKCRRPDLSAAEKRETMPRWGIGEALLQGVFFNVERQI